MVEWSFMDAQAFCDCGGCLKNLTELLVFFHGNFISFAASLNEVQNILLSNVYCGVFGGANFFPFSIFIRMSIPAAAFLLEHPSLEGETPPAKKRRSVSCFKNTFACVTFPGRRHQKQCKIATVVDVVIVRLVGSLVTPLSTNYSRKMGRK